MNAVLELLVDEVSAQEISNQTSVSRPQSFAKMFWRALCGEQSLEMQRWESQNRESMQTFDRGYRALLQAREELQIGIRTEGLLQTIEGFSEITIGCFGELATLPTGV